MHQEMAEVLETVLSEIREIQSASRNGNPMEDPLWPVLVLRTPKGWTGPKTVDGKPVEDTWRSHQVPISDPRHNPEHLRILEEWLRSYRPDELFDENGRLKPELAALAPEGDHRMGMNPHSNGGALLKDLDLPAWTDFAIDVPSPGKVKASPTKVLGSYLREAMTRNSDNFRVFAPTS